MKGDIAFAGFVLTADEWLELDHDARSQLIAVATRQTDPWIAAPADPMRLAEGSGPLDSEDIVELDVEPLSEVDEGWEEPPVFAAGTGVGPTPNWSAAGDIDFGPVLDPLLESRLLTKLR
ncbi:MAG TPA: hypothetical protein VL326_32015 [Kofleriaceae bacterium]|jgi:hypothetical protein|nr:hypothetical protein [Kofleriaceae bacterium]